MFEFPHNKYRKVLLENLNRDNIKIWFDAGGGYYTGLSEENIKAAKKKSIHIISSDRDKSSLGKNKQAKDLIICDLEKIPLKDNYADIITLRMVVEHLENPDNVLRELTRILKPEGRMIIYTPNLYNPWRIVAIYFPTFYINKVKKKWWNMPEEDIYPHYYKLNTRKKIKKTLGKLGLEEKAFYYLPYTYFPRKTIFYYMEYVFALMLHTIRIFDDNIIGVYQK